MEKGLFKHTCFRLVFNKETETDVQTNKHSEVLLEYHDIAAFYLNLPSINLFLG